MTHDGEAEAEAPPTPVEQAAAPSSPVVDPDPTVVAPWWGRFEGTRTLSRIGAGLMGASALWSLLSTGFSQPGTISLSLVAFLIFFYKGFLETPEAAADAERERIDRLVSALSEEAGVDLAGADGEPVSAAEARVRVEEARDLVDRHVRPPAGATVVFIAVISIAALLALLNPAVLSALGLPIGLPLLLVGVPLVAGILGVVRSRRRADRLDAALDRQLEALDREADSDPALRPTRPEDPPTSSSARS